MNYVFPGFAIAYVVAAIFSFVTAAITWTRRSNPGNDSFALLMLSLCAWSFASIFEAGTLVVNDKLFWSKWQYIGIATLPPLWLFFAAEFTHQKIFDKKIQAFLLTIPIITLVMAFTNEFHHLLWSRITILPGPLHIAEYDHGPWFYIHIIYSYLLLAIGTYWLLKAFWKNPANKRRQIFILFFGVTIGWISNILYVAGLIPVKGFDPTPLSFTFIAGLMAWSIFQNRLFDIVPVARNLLLDNMTDGVIVLDQNDVIIDINPAASKLIKDKKTRSLMGLNIVDAFGKHTNVAKKIKSRSDFQAELKLSTETQTYINLSVSNVFSEKKERVGKIVTIRDITEKKLIEIKESEQRKMAEALADTAAIINSTLDLDEVLEKILENIGKVVPHDTANIALIDGNNTARCVRTKGYEKYGMEKIITDIELRIDKIHNLKRMSQTKKASINPDTDADPEWDREIPGSSWIRSYMGAPIIGKGEVLGFINLDAAVPNFYKEEFIPRLEAFANQAAVAIENAQFFKEISDSATKMSILYEVGLAVTSGFGLEKTIKALFTQLKRVVPIDLFAVAFLDRERGNAEFTIYGRDGVQIIADPISMVKGDSLARYAIEKGEIVYIPDSMAEDSEFPDEKIVRLPGHHERSIIGIPMKLRNEIQGILFLMAAPPNSYSRDHVWLIETIANQASIAMDNARLFEQVQEMAIKDSLTGIYNRRYFHVFAENEIARSQRYEKNLSLIMVDIDHFKKINDKFGHLIGDLTLKMVADACLSILRKVDILCRFGGEEFVVMLPETSQSDAINVAQRICKIVAEKKLPTEKGDVSVTISLGVTQLRNDKQTLLDLLNEADRALYEAKNAGRNCVYVFKPKSD